MGVESSYGGEIDFVAEEAFELLGNETRMEILQGLWQAYDPLSESNGLSFSSLYDRVSLSDSGQFNYHLDKLLGIYVRKSDNKYQLRPVGLKLIQAVLAGAGKEINYGPIEVDETCRLCNAPVQLTYEGGRVYLVCSECEGNFDDPKFPKGTLWWQVISPAGVVNRSPEELYSTFIFIDWPRKAMMTGRVCPECTGMLRVSTTLCEDHKPVGDQPCPECGYVEEIRSHWICTICKFHRSGPPAWFIRNHPAVISFRYEHDIDFGYPYSKNDFEEVQANEPLIRDINYEQNVLSSDPLRIGVTVSYRENSIELTMDENLAVTDVSRDVQ